MPAADASNNICAFIQVRGALTPQNCEAAVQKGRGSAGSLPSLDPSRQGPADADDSEDWQADARLPRTLVLAKPAGGDRGTRAGNFQQALRPRAGPRPIAREVFRRGADDHVLVFAIHHAIADGWTLGVFVQDLFAAYLQSVRGVKTALPPVPLSYTAWGAAERAFWQPVGVGTADGSFWKTNARRDTRRLWSPPAGPAAGSGGAASMGVACIPAELTTAQSASSRGGVGPRSSARSSPAFQVTLVAMDRRRTTSWSARRSPIVANRRCARRWATAPASCRCAGRWIVSALVPPAVVRAVHHDDGRCLRQRHALRRTRDARSAMQRPAPGHHPIFDDALCVAKSSDPRCRHAGPLG